MKRLLSKLMVKDSWVLALALLLIVFGLIFRLLPHPANFAPIAAIALFGALYLPRRLAIILPLVALFLSDLLIGFYQLEVMISVYACFAVMGLIGLWVRAHKNVVTILGGTLLGSLIFFLVTNAAVWHFGVMYPHDLTGLALCYELALPFFRNSLAGDLFYVSVLVVSMEMAMNWRTMSLRTYKRLQNYK